VSRDLKRGLEVLTFVCVGLAVFDRWGLTGVVVLCALVFFYDLMRP
jgi:hypothetical protein